MSKARRFGETLAKMLVERAGIALDPKLPQYKRIGALVKAGVIPENVRQLFDVVRNEGNKAIHGYSGDVQKAISVLAACFELGVWWFRTRTGSEPPHVFVPPVPVPATSTRELLERVEKQITKLHAAFAAGVASADTAAPGPEPKIRIGPAAPDRYSWRGGSEVACGSMTYLVHDPVETVSADDRSWTIMQASARGLDAHARRVWLRGLLTESGSPAANQMVEGLNAQASYLNGRARRSGLPELISRHQDGKLRIVVLGGSTGSSWREMFGAGQPPLDPFMVPLALDVLAGIAEALVELHRTGHAHRALDGESIRVTATGRRGVLRDIGLAWWPRLSGEGGQYRAPEQQSMSRGRPGPATDIFQLAALLQQSCAGFKPSAGRAIPLKTILPAFPEQLDKLLVQALDPDPVRRPNTATFAAGLRQGRRHFFTEATA
jgi:hypothetical protein